MIEIEDVFDNRGWSVWRKVFGYLSVISLSLSSFFMAFDQEYRLLSYVALGVFFCISLFGLLIKGVMYSIWGFRSAVYVLFLVVLLCCLQLYSALDVNGSLEGFDFFRIFYPAIVCFGILVALSLWGGEWYSLRLVSVISLLGFLSVALYFLGFYLDSFNYYAALFLMPVMYSLVMRRYIYFVALLSLILFLGVLFEARGVYLVVLLFMIVYPIFRLVNVNAWGVVAGLIFLLIGQFYLMHTQTLAADEFLSYRPTIWNYYFFESLDRMWIGNGPILLDVSEGAAAYYQYMIGRGVGLSYGTQSMYLLYFYESGLLGLFVLLMICYLVFRTRSKYLPPVLAVLVLAFLETVKIGAVSVYGLPLTYFSLLSLISGDIHEAE